MVCAIEYKGQLTGVLSYIKILEWLRKVELGYWLSLELQARGIISRSCKKLIHHAFTEMKMQKVEMRVATENVASRTVCEQLGCSLEGIINNAGEYQVVLLIWLYMGFIQKLGKCFSVGKRAIWQHYIYNVLSANY